MADLVCHPRLRRRPATPLVPLPTPRNPTAPVAGPSRNAPRPTVVPSHPKLSDKPSAAPASLQNLHSHRVPDRTPPPPLALLVPLASPPPPSSTDRLTPIRRQTRSAPGSPPGSPLPTMSQADPHPQPDTQYAPSS